MKRIPIDEIRSRISYNPLTGRFVWLVDNRGHAKAGDEAGSINSQGYWRIKIRQVAYMAHRLAWALHYGEDPPGEIDHIDGNPLNNRISNLRIASRVDNCRNVKGSGVRFEQSRGKWLARIGVDYKTINLGRYDTREEALAAVRAARIMHFGEFAREPS